LGAADSLAAGYRANEIIDEAFDGDEEAEDRTTGAVAWAGRRLTEEAADQWSGTCLREATRNARRPSGLP
jgi:uncharacterized Ntn-hydrolase superfamily protein